ncbi:hypothetical protein JXJ21_08465, partial [candidate division KSB1 bacterium]|nr:hypothetical protein [candidate division KSB1 bacterium]
EFEDLLNDQQDIKQKILNQLNAIKTHVETIDQKTEVANKLEIILNTLQGILAVFEKERKKYVTEILENIASVVEALYTQVHPDEGIGSIHFFLKPNVQGSLEYTGYFHKIDVPPQAYFSESHLDTLGVCIFLALAKYYNDENTIIILDDVITSVDQAHMSRFINMIHNEASNYNQLIITTHYRPWRDKYRFATGTNSNIQLIELLHWSLNRGIRHTKTKFSIDEIEEYLREDKFDRQVVASKSGILLECILDHLALLFRCRLPRQAEPNYTLGDLIHSIDNKLKKLIKIIRAENNNNECYISDKLDELYNMVWIRNQVGCHFNIIGLQISDPEIIAFGKKTVEFANLLICIHCGEIPARNKSGSYWQCKCGKTNLYPLIKPN